MKAVIVIDSFKGCLSSREAGDAVEKGILRAIPEAETVIPEEGTVMPEEETEMSEEETVSAEEETLSSGADLQDETE